MSSTRPIIVAGPIDRNSNPRRSGSVDALGGGPAGVPPPRCAHIGAVVTRQTARIRRERLQSIVCILSKARKPPRWLPTLTQGFGGGQAIHWPALGQAKPGCLCCVYSDRRSAFPGRTAVSFPPSTTILPLTSTKSNPCEYWCGLA